MNYLHQFTLLLGLFGLFLGPAQAQQPSKSVLVPINWEASLSEDFSFQQQWQYPEGIYRNRFGQLCCDGLCPEGVSHMKNTAGKILPKYLILYYQLVDTTHQFHTVQSTTNAYEFAQTHFVKAKHDATRNITRCYTLSNVATHSTLNLEILATECKAKVSLNSIRPEVGTQTFYCTGGQIKIDQTAWKTGRLKAVFDLHFYNHLAPSTPLYWKGKIVTRIE